MIDVTELLTDPDFSEHYSIFRKQNHWVKGEVETTEIEIKMYSPVQPVNTRDIQMIPEGDRQTGIIKFLCKENIHLSNDEGMSDELFWRGYRYKVIQVTPWNSFGWVRAFAIRKDGK